MTEILDDEYLYPDESSGQNYEAIGKFITAFATLDAELLELLRITLGTSLPVTRAIYGGKSTPDLTGAIQSLLRLEDKSPTLGAFDELANDIDDLRLARNAVAHRVMFVNGEKMAFTDVFTRKSLGSEIGADIYTISDLNDFSKYAHSLSLRTKLIAMAQTANQSRNEGAPLDGLPVARHSLPERPRALKRKGQSPQSKPK